jgi:hypothetical protein
MVSQARDKRRRWNGRTERKGEAGERSNRTRVPAGGVLMGIEGASGNQWQPGDTSEIYLFQKITVTPLHDRQRCPLRSGPHDVGGVACSLHRRATTMMMIIQMDVGHVRMRRSPTAGACAKRVRARAQLSSPSQRRGLDRRSVCIRSGRQGPGRDAPASRDFWTWSAH